MFKNQGVRIVAGFVVGVLVGVGSYWLWANRNVKGSLESDVDGSTLTTSTSTTSKLEISQDSLLGNAALTIADQNPGIFNLQSFERRKETNRR